MSEGPLLSPGLPLPTAPDPVKGVDTVSLGSVLTCDRDTVIVKSVNIPERERERERERNSYSLTFAILVMHTCM